MVSTGEGIAIVSAIVRCEVSGVEAEVDTVKVGDDVAEDFFADQEGCRGEERITSRLDLDRVVKV